MQLLPCLARSLRSHVREFVMLIFFPFISATGTPTVTAICHIFSSSVMLWGNVRNVSDVRYLYSLKAMSKWQMITLVSVLTTLISVLKQLRIV